MKPFLQVSNTAVSSISSFFPHLWASGLWNLSFCSPPNSHQGNSLSPLDSGSGFSPLGQGNIEGQTFPNTPSICSQVICLLSILISPSVECGPKYMLNQSHLLSSSSEKQIYLRVLFKSNYCSNGLYFHRQHYILHCPHFTPSRVNLQQNHFHFKSLSNKANPGVKMGSRLCRCQKASLLEFPLTHGCLLSEATSWSPGSILPQVLLLWHQWSSVRIRPTRKLPGLPWWCSG